MTEKIYISQKETALILQAIDAAIKASGLQGAAQWMPLAMSLHARASEATKTTAQPPSDALATD